MMRARLTEADLLGMVEESREELMASVEPRLNEAVDVVVRAAKSNLARQRGTRATAAAPGQPPEYDTGELHDSVKPMRIRKTKYAIRKEYGSEHPSAGLHEWGGTVTRNGVKRTYPPRPYLRPAEEASAEEVDRILGGG